MRAHCPVCRRLVGVNVPKGGDGSAVRPYRHTGVVFPCAGSYRIIDRAKVIDE